MKVGICDDVNIDRESIRKLCEQYSHETKIELEIVEFSSGDEILAYDGALLNLLFLDIEMDDIDGIQVKKQLEKANNIWRIIFVSRHEEAVWDTFGIKTLDFGKKPVTYEKVKKWFDIAVLEFNEDKMIIFDKTNMQRQLRISEIVYLEGCKNYVMVYTNKGNAFVVSKNLKYWYDYMDCNCIGRLHKSYLINFDYIETIGKKVTIKHSDKSLPIGRTYKEIIKKEYDLYLLKKIRHRL